MNTNINALQAIVTALQNNDYVKSVTPVMENGKEIGYTITFSKSNPVTIYHGQNGKDGANGADGKDGVNGKDGHTPVIGVRQDSDGVYYWTLDGEWLLDGAGNKVKAEGRDGQNGADGANGSDGKDGENGKDGADGKDGITPQLKIENGYWYVSTDNGATWTNLGKATGENGKDGANGTDGKDGIDGDSMFQSVTQDENNVYFTLADGTIITISKKSQNLFEQLQSVIYIPKYSDGTVAMVKNLGDKGIAEFDFQISPRNTVKEIATNWQSILSMKAVYTTTRTISYIDLPILSCESDEAKGVITIKVSGENLSQDFYIQKTTASASLYISDGNSDISSDFIPIFADVLAYREIRYKTSNKTIIAPRHPNAVNDGTATLISNTYEGDWGVLRFDKQIYRVGGLWDYAHPDYSDPGITTLYFSERVTELDSRIIVGQGMWLSIKAVYLASPIAPKIGYQPFAIYSSSNVWTKQYPKIYVPIGSKELYEARMEGYNIEEIEF